MKISMNDLNQYRQNIRTQDPAASRGDARLEDNERERIVRESEQQTRNPGPAGVGQTIDYRA